MWVRGPDCSERCPRRSVREVSHSFGRGVYVKSNMFWCILFGMALLLSFVAAFFLRRGQASQARVYKDGVLIERLDISAAPESYYITIDHEDGVNVIAVENGRIYISEADCPDRSCVRQGWISGGAMPIVCLPHRLVIELDRNEAPGVDAIAR